MALLKAVIDACIIESALRSQLGASYQILSNINTNKFRFGISVALFLEYEYRIEYLFSSRIIIISEKAKNSILKALAFYGDEVPIYYKIRPNLKDENDNMVFECAANYDADYLVTHNVKDFFSSELGKYRFEIIKPQQFLEIMRYG
ncbi:MAG: putative toxin-antitoxin system toxin component, PIN family [candidate division KSB1 bacterium]|nr:putative toxin-antitoxin system toxin component, PIN family [candidate division KSB1 bacterium]